MNTQTQTVLKFDDLFYLKHKKSGKYLVSVGKGRYDFPRLDNKQGIKLQVKHPEGNNTGNLKNGNKIKIRSLEDGLGNNRILGAFRDSHNCYYWKDGYDNDKQSWTIHKVGNDGGVICDGDEVCFTNVSYSNQTLVADDRYDGYLTTKKNALDTWIIESVNKKQPVVESNTNTKNPASVFGLSVASGDPSATGVILWTRINPEVYKKEEKLTYQVCESKNFDNCVIDEEVSASFGEETDYTVHVDLDGRLEAYKTYFYRFHYAGVYSKTGRCKTLQASDKDMSSLRLAVITCNDYSTGYFNAFYHLAELEEQKQDIDFVVHLGDFVYEYAQYPPSYGHVYREDIKWKQDPRYKSEADDIQRAISLENFQQIYRTYRQDLALQAAMEQHTWIVTLDDHEVADNWYWNYDEETINVDKAHPAFNKTKKEKKDLYNNAIKAWRQYVPARLEEVDKDKIDKELEPHEYHIYRRFHFGKLVDFFLTDSRSYRSKPRPDLGADDKVNPQPTMLGQKQKEWLTEGIKNSDATWKVWGNQTLLATSSINTFIANYVEKDPDIIDDWQAYMGERKSILQTIKHSETKKHGNKNNKSNFVVFTGDMHTSMISYLHHDFTGVGNGDRSKIAGVEFMTPSLTSPGISEGLRKKIPGYIPDSSMINDVMQMLPNIFSNDSSDDAGEGSTLHKVTAGLMRFNTYIKHYDSSINGYAIAEFTADELKWEVYAVNKSDHRVADDGSNISKRGANKHLAKTMKYDPNTITLDDHIGG
ncbi:MAG: alkaline phosphatase D family protein [Rivularia sp. (in: cyanobacteria)]